MISGTLCNSYDITHDSVFSAIPASALNEEDDDESDDEGEVIGEERDDEKSGTKYNVGHFIFILFSCLSFLDSIHGSMSSLQLPRCTCRCC